MSADTTPGLDYEREQDAFELAFPMPANCLRFPGGYAPTEFNAWDASKFCERWEGWKAARRAPAPAQGPTDAEIADVSLEFVRQERLSDFDYVAFARAVLARWGAPAASGEPVARKPLTQSQIAAASREAQVQFCLDKQPTYEVALAREVEAAHGIKQ